jgi:hypothetical protein
MNSINLCPSSKIPMQNSSFTHQHNAGFALLAAYLGRDTWPVLMIDLIKANFKTKSGRVLYRDVCKSAAKRANIPVQD